MKKIAYLTALMLCFVALCFTVSAAHEHNYKTTVTAQATLTENGKSVEKCSCGKVKSKSSKSIYKIKSVTLSEKSFTYNGKQRTPSVTVKDSKGNALKKGTDYTVKYESGRKLPGKYNVKITFKGKYSGEAKAVFTVKPKATAKVTATHTESSITLKWKRVTGADGYAIFQHTAKGWKRIKTVTSADTLNCTVKKLTPGTVYKFRVKAFTKDSGTIWGEATKTIKTATNPSAVKNASATATTASVTLKWNKVAGADGYAIFQHKSGEWKRIRTITSADTVSFKVSKLTPGTVYKFRIKAFKKANGTSWGQASKTLTATTKIATPSNIVITTTGDSVAFEWDAVPGADGYAIYDYLSGKWRRTLIPAEVRYYGWGNLEPDAVCTFYIRAYNDNAWSEASETMTAIPNPPSPAKVSATPSVNSVTLKWSKVDGVDGYGIFQYRNGSWKGIKNVTSPDADTCTVENLKINTAYTLGVRAYKKLNSKIVWSDTVCKISTSTVPAATEKVTCTSTADSVTLNWTKANGATSYKIYRQIYKKWVLIGETTALSKTVTGLSENLTCSFRIVSCYSNGSRHIDGNYKEVSATTKTTSVSPKAPEKITATTTNSTVTLSWSHVKGATGYRIYEYYGGWEKVADTAETTYTVTDCMHADYTCYSVRAYKKTGDKIIWSPDITEIDTYTKPSPAKEFMGAPLKNSIILSWTSDSCWNELYYDLYFYDTATKKYTIIERNISPYDFNTDWYTVTGLEKGKTYTFAVRTHYTYYENDKEVICYSDLSEHISITTQTGDGSAIGMTTFGDEPGVRIYPISSKQANRIYEKHYVYDDYRDKLYEGKSADGKTVVLYCYSEGEWEGLDLQGIFYTGDGHKRLCYGCDKYAALNDGENMCDGIDCYIFFV